MLTMRWSTTLVAGGKKRFSSHRAFVNSVLSGAACSVAVYECHAYLYAHISPKSAMRGDWVKVGGDFGTVMMRAREEAAAEE